MKKFLFTMLTFAIIIGTGIVHAAAPEGWTTDFDKALAEAKAAKKHVFVLFTGSDWCGWCIKLRKNVLDNKKFKKFAKENLVLVYCDFPAKKKLPAAEMRKNRALQQRLNAPGGFPGAVVVTPEGKVTGKISGYRDCKDYIKELKSIIK